MSWPRDLFEPETPENEAAAMVRKWDQSAGQGYDGVQIDCWDKDEATRIKAEFQRLRPGVRVYVTWMDFTRRA